MKCKRHCAIYCMTANRQLSRNLRGGDSRMGGMTLLFCFFVAVCMMGMVARYIEGLRGESAGRDYLCPVVEESEERHGRWD
jgi:hypothetical protein